jgi:hypothetical protein
MNEVLACVRGLQPHRILAGPLTLSLALALSAPGCSPGPAPSQVGGGMTSKVPEIAKRRQHMEAMLKKAESKAKAAAEPRRRAR